jgi:hypothetical protein
MIARVHGSTSIWISVGVAVIVAGVAVISMSRRKPRIDLGAVSERWTAEHRAGPSAD